MKSFPKKYNPKDLRNRSKHYRENNNFDKKYNTIFSTSTLPSSKKISYRDFFLIYLKDFFNKKFFLEDKKNELSNNYEQLFIVSGELLNNISSSYNFFSKRNQSLLQIGANKLERHILSSTKKHINANHKILNSYSSSNHKIYLPDLDLYTYILELFHSLWNKEKIINEVKIGYRSFNLQTSIPLEKISRKEEKIPLYTIKYFIGAKGDALYVPVEGDIDTCCGDVALLVHPKDKRYNKYIGKKVIIPLCNRQIPIIGDENVNISINNGIQRICPCSDEPSIELAQKFGLPMDIYAFNKEGLYTEHIHENAFIGKKRSKYYSNIVKFIDDIGNIAEIGEKTTLVPYLEQINERLTPYKMDQFIINLQEDKEKIINDFTDNNINYPTLNSNIFKIIEESESIPSKNTIEKDDNIEDIDNINNEELNIIDEKKQNLTKKLDAILPNFMVCNSQIPFGWKIPLMYDSNGKLTFFDIEKDCLKRKLEPQQFCFNFVILSLIRIGIIQIKNTYGDTDEHKICEYDKFYKTLSENEKKIEYFVQQLSKITGNKPEYKQFLELIENLTENDKTSINDLSKLIKNCKFLTHKGIRLVSNIKGVINDVIDTDLIHLCIPCYLSNKGIKVNNRTIFTEDKKNNIFKELLIQQLLLGKTISNRLLEENYDNESEFIGNKELTSFQIEQSQRDFFSLYGENPVRLNLLTKKAFNQKEIILNSIFLKQIRNATRLCIQKNFLPKDTGTCLNKQPNEFDDYDIFVLNKLNELLFERKNINSYEEYIKFFNTFKGTAQNIFFSRYLEILKVHPTANTQFVCSYFFSFLTTVLYPLVPEFTEALQYISEKNFFNIIEPIKLNKAVNYNTTILFDTFTKIKQLKLENNIKQHKTCNIFIKSTPTICEIFAENEQIFKNYFHVSEINYIRLHETNPLGYEIFSDELLTIGIQNGDFQSTKEKDSIESIERDIKDLEEKLDLLRQRIQLLPEGEQRSKTEEEYAQTKDEIETLTIKHSILSSK